MRFKLSLNFAIPHWTSVPSLEHIRLLGEIDRPLTPNSSS